MCDRSTERRQTRFVLVHVNELVVVGRIRKLIDALLRNFQPFRWLGLPADEFMEL